MNRKRAVPSFIVICAVSIFLGAGVAFAVDLPDAFKGIPLFPDSKVENVMDMPGHTMATMAMQGAKPDAVADFYTEALKEKGWKADFRVLVKHTLRLQFQKEGKMLNINLEPKVEPAMDTTICNMILKTGSSDSRNGSVYNDISRSKRNF